MRKLLPIFFFFLLISCLDEEGVPPAQPTTFVRYYSGGFNEAAVAFAETADKGFIILSSVSFKANSDTLYYKIKLLKTDAYGVPTWSALYPPDVKTGSLKEILKPDVNYRPTSMQLLPNGGYVVTGEDIQKDSTKVLLMRVDANGQNPIITSLGAKKLSGVSNVAVTGQALGLNKSNNLLVLSTSGSSDMVLGEMKQDFTSSTTTKFMWNNRYDAGTTSLANKLFLDASEKVFWAGTANKFGQTGIRVVKTSQNSQNVDFDLMHINPGFVEEATDFCRFGLGYAIVGSTDQKAATGAKGDKDILFKRLSESGVVLESKSFSTNEKDPTKDTQNDVGNSISSTQDGGLILLASVNSIAIDGRGDDDFLLIKIDAFGKEAWRTHFGSRFKDAGVAVRQLSDGGYVVLGTTLQGNQEIVMLAKTNALGVIE